MKVVACPPSFPRLTDRRPSLRNGYDPSSLVLTEAAKDILHVFWSIRHVFLVFFKTWKFIMTWSLGCITKKYGKLVHLKSRQKEDWRKRRKKSNYFGKPQTFSMLGGASQNHYCVALNFPFYKSKGKKKRIKIFCRHARITNVCQNPFTSLLLY